MKEIWIILMVLLIICGCARKKDTFKRDLTDIMHEGNFVLLDVRSAGEYEARHIEGSINIPHDKIDEISDLPKDKTIIVFCQTGRRSGVAADKLENLSFTVFDAKSIDNIQVD